MSTATAITKTNAIAIGGFDGMHVGHQHLFDALGSQGAIVVIETGYANLTPGCEREHYTHYPLYYYPLEEIRHLEGQAFIAMLCRRFPKLHTIVVGYDFHFGKDRRYSVKDLKRFFRGEVRVIEEVCVGNDSVHSHKIRAKLELGDIQGANTFLGHNYTVKGSVVTGQGLGARSLVATLNLHVKQFLLPMQGVYATLSRLDDEVHYHPSVTFIGHRISTDGSFAVETHLLDEETITAHKVAVSFVGFIRANKKFESLIALKTAIDADIKRSHKILNYLCL